MVGNIVCTVIPYKTFKEKIRLTKKYEKYKVEVYKDYVLVLGDMGELGEREAEYHKELGRYINKHSGLSKDAIILSVGKLSKNITNEITNCTAKHFDTIEQCINWIKDNINKDRTLFLKASRSMKFENIITGLNIS